jgi:hypothetical protein
VNLGKVVQQQRLVASLGDGGFLTWRSSPHVMWLAWHLEQGRARENG